MGLVMVMVMLRLSWLNVLVLVLFLNKSTAPGMVRWGPDGFVIIRYSVIMYTGYFHLKDTGIIIPSSD
jgi:hypothetical protein